MLIEDVIAECHDPLLRIARFPLGQNFDLGPDRVARAHGGQESPAFHRQQRNDGIAEQAFGHCGRHRHGEGARRDSAAILRTFCVFLVDEQWHVVTDEGAEK